MSSEGSISPASNTKHAKALVMFPMTLKFSSWFVRCAISLASLCRSIHRFCCESRHRRRIHHFDRYVKWQGGYFGESLGEDLGAWCLHGEGKACETIEYLFFDTPRCSPVTAYPFCLSVWGTCFSLVI